MSCECAEVTVKNKNNYCCYLPTAIDPMNTPSKFWVIVCETESLLGKFSQVFKNGDTVDIYIQSVMKTVTGTICNVIDFGMMSTLLEEQKNSKKYDPCCKSCCHPSSFAAGKFELVVLSTAVSQHTVTTAVDEYGRKPY